jgi:type 1 fimbria pilin
MMLATATFSVGGVSSAMADPSAQDTDPIQGEDVSVELGRVTASFERATLAFEDGTMQFRGRSWVMEGPESTVSGGNVRATISDVSPETYATVRAAMVEADESNSPFPLVEGLATADVNPDASIRVVTSSVEQDGQLLADRITAAGRYGAVVPEGLREGGQIFRGGAEVGPSEWKRITAQRGDSELVFEDVAVTVRPSDTSQTVRDIQLDLLFGSITRDGETLASNFETSSTLAKLFQALPTQNTADVDTDRLPSEVVVTSEDDTFQNYVFEVTDDLEKLEPDEDSGEAVDTVTRSGDRVRVEGAVGTGDDRFAFSGDLVEVDVPPGVNLEITER